MLAEYALVEPWMLKRFGLVRPEIGDEFRIGRRRFRITDYSVEDLMWVCCDLDSPHVRKLACG